MVSSSGMPVSLKTDLRFPITGQQGHGSRNIQGGSPRDESAWLSADDLYEYAYDTHIDRKSVV